MTYADDSGSRESSEPREGIELILPSVTYRLATGTRDRTINGQRFTASPSGREEIKLATSDNQADLVIQLPMKHPIPQRWLALGSPPKSLVANVYRLQLNSGEYRRIWTGYVTSIASTSNNTVALLRVPSRDTALLDRRLPTITIGKSCPHTLYDRNCRVDRAAFTQDANLADVQGRVVKVSTMGAHPDTWAENGELLHVPSGERMTILSQVGTTITMHMPIPEMQVGHAVQVVAGCPHDIESCVVLFDNRVNFGGFPQLNSVNPVRPTGFGVSVQS